MSQLVAIVADVSGCKLATKAIFHFQDRCGAALWRATWIGHDGEIKQKAILAVGCAYDFSLIGIHQSSMTFGIIGN